MAKYRKEIEAIAYIGDNVEEIKEMLGEDYDKIDKDRCIWYKHGELKILNFIRPNIDTLVKEVIDDENIFWDCTTENFIKTTRDFELVE